MRPELLRRVMFRDRQRWLAHKVALYAANPSQDQITAHQAERFNARWRECQSHPFYRRWAKEHDLPQSIEHPGDLRSWPLLTKETVVQHAEEIFSDGDRSAYSTGGSTGRPVNYPRGKSDVGPIYGNMYACRSWWGVRPFDPQIMLWGHAHLFGKGIGGHARVLQRRVADRVLNMSRLDAYDMRSAALEADAKHIVRNDPSFIYGYTTAMFKVAQRIRDLYPGYEPRKLRAVSVTAETVTDADLETIATAFKCPVTIEYGTAETGVIAGSRHETRHIQVLWDGHIARADDSGQLVLSTLDPRRFPLINYAVEDIVEPLEEVDGNCFAFRRVLGRQKDVLTLSTAAGEQIEVSAIMPVHILKTFPGITGVQFSRVPPSSAVVHVEVDGTLDIGQLAAYFRAQFARDFPEVDTDECFTFELSQSTDLTVAGKHRLFRN